MQLGPNRSYIMVFVAAAMLLMLAVLISKSSKFLNSGPMQSIGETKPSAIEKRYSSEP